MCWESYTFSTNQPSLIPQQPWESLLSGLEPESIILIQSEEARSARGYPTPEINGVHPF